MTEESQYYQQDLLSHLQTEPTSSSHRMERRVQLLLQRMHREREQMRLFRRFRFQATRAESALATMPLMYHRLYKMGPTDKEDSTASVEHEVADQIYSQMLKRWEGNHDARQPDIMCGLKNLGAVLIIYRKLKEAEEIFARILAETEGSLRHEDIDTVSQTLGNLAVAKTLQGKDQEAEILLRRALHAHGQQADLRSDSSWQFFVLCNNLAVALINQNRVKEARDILEPALERQSFSFRDGDIREALANLKFIPNW